MEVLLRDMAMAMETYLDLGDQAKAAEFELDFVQTTQWWEVLEYPGPCLCFKRARKISDRTNDPRRKLEF